MLRRYQINHKYMNLTFKIYMSDHEENVINGDHHYLKK